MKVICFVGKNDSGKSNIINRILKDKFGIIVFKHGRDSCLTIEYKGKRIGICGYGDTPELLKKHLANLKDCYSVICVRRLDNESENVIKDFFGNDIYSIYCNKSDGETKEIRDNKRYKEFEKEFDKSFSV